MAHIVGIGTLHAIHLILKVKAMDDLGHNGVIDTTVDINNEKMIGLMTNNPASGIVIIGFVIDSFILGKPNIKMRGIIHQKFAICFGFLLRHTVWQELFSDNKEQSDTAHGSTFHHVRQPMIDSQYGSFHGGIHRLLVSVRGISIVALKSMLSDSLYRKSTERSTSMISN